MSVEQFARNMRMISANPPKVYYPNTSIVIDVPDVSQESVPRASKKQRVLGDRKLVLFTFVVYEESDSSDKFYLREGYFHLGKAYRINRFRIVAQATCRIDDVRLAHKIFRTKPFDIHAFDALSLSQHQKLLIRRDVDWNVPVRVFVRTRSCSATWVHSSSGPALDIELLVDLLEFREM